MNGLYVILLVLIIGGVILALYAAKKEEDNVKKRSKIIDEKITRLSNFTITQKVVGLNYFYVFAVDHSHRKIAYIEEDYEIVLPYDKIICVEIDEDNTTIASKSTSRSIGGAIVGGIIAGGAGAIIGGLNGNTITKKVVSLVQVKLKLRDINAPAIIIKCFDSKSMLGIPETKTEGKNGQLYYQGLEDARMISDLVSVIIDDVDKKETEVRNTNKGSIVDEIAKLAELKEKGILSEDEFLEQKRKLLNN